MADNQELQEKLQQLDHELHEGDITTKGHAARVASQPALTGGIAMKSAAPCSSRSIWATTLPSSSSNCNSPTRTSSSRTRQRTMMPRQPAPNPLRSIWPTRPAKQHASKTHSWASPPARHNGMPRASLRAVRCLSPGPRLPTTAPHTRTP